MSQMAYKTFHITQSILTLLFPRALSGFHLPAVMPTNGDHDTGIMAEGKAQNHYTFLIFSTPLMILSKACT